MIADNCLVCRKPINEIGEMEQGMCDKCNRETYRISQEQLKEDKKFNELNSPIQNSCTETVYDRGQHNIDIMNISKCKKCGSTKSIF